MGIALGACLWISELPGNWGHFICGPWGCGPPLQALVACHTTWFTLLFPPTIVVARARWISAGRLWIVGLTIATTATFVLVGMIIRERLVWWESVGHLQQGYFWQRCGFILATSVDIPVIQSFLVGIYMVFSPHQSRVKKDQNQPAECNGLSLRNVE